MYVWWASRVDICMRGYLPSYPNSIQTIATCKSSPKVWFYTLHQMKHDYSVHGVRGFVPCRSLRPPVHLLWIHVPNCMKVCPNLPNRTCGALLCKTTSRSQVAHSVPNVHASLIDAPQVWPAGWCPNSCALLCPTWRCPPVRVARACGCPLIFRKYILKELFFSKHI